MLLLTALLSFLQLQTPSSVLACTCAPFPLERSYNDADAVFSGRALEVERRQVTRPEDGWTYTHHTYIFEVTKIWKGVYGSQVKAYYDSDYISPEGIQVDVGCEPGGFVIGEEYLVFAKSHPGNPVLEADLGGCARTTLIENAPEYVEILEQIADGELSLGMPKTGAGPNLVGAAVLQPSSVTPVIVEISPTSGGPGTVVQVRGLVGNERVALFLAVLGAPQATTGSRCPDLNGPIISLGGTEGPGFNQPFTATVTLPAAWSPGQPITETDLCIVAGEEGHFTDFKLFAFVPPALPTAGRESGTDWWMMILLAVSCTALGGLALKKAHIIHRSSRQY